MVAGNGASMNCFTARSLSLFTSAIIYGANASGKSNVLRAFDFMKSLVLNAPKILQSTDRIPYDPFKLSSETEGASSSFEVVFIHGEIKYRYGFEIDGTRVYAEWLFADEKGKEAKLFFRDSDKTELYVNTERFKEGRGVKVLPNSLFLWRCDQEGGAISRSVLSWFLNLNFLNGIQANAYMGYTINQMRLPDFRSQILKLVHAADLGIYDISIDERDLTASELDAIPLPTEIREQLRNGESPLKRLGVQALHEKFDSGAQLIGFESFDFAKDESEGTKKYFCLSAPIIDTMKNGKILVIDELDASLHPMLTHALVGLFNNPETNPRNAQLIFATHDTNLLDQKLFHKSQIWFTEKDKCGSTRLNSLVEYKNVRATDNIEKHYIQGKYGAIPFLGHFDFEVS
jgi:hypothetical protein